MKLNDLYKAFSDSMAQKQLYQRAMGALAEKELAELTAYYETHKSHPQVLEFAEAHNMIFYDAKDGSIRYYAQMQRSVQDQITAVYLHKNKQYQWLLAEAYEAFEEFLENLYAYIGSVSSKSWPMSDFGNISLDDIPSKDFDWYRHRVKEKRDKPTSILNQMRKLFPEIANLEVNNHFKLNLRLSINMIEMLRHIIVHKSGIVDDKDKFIEDLLQKAGLYQNGDPKPEHLGFINSFFGGAEYQNHITLLEVPVHKDMPIKAHIDRFDLLTGHIMSYSYNLVETIRTNLS